MAEKKVYLIGPAAGGDGAYKIGIANEPDSRLTQLQVASWLELKIWGWMWGTELDERNLHHLHWGKKLRGEWFHLTEEERDEIIRDMENKQRRSKFDDCGCGCDGTLDDKRHGDRIIMLASMERRRLRQYG